MTELELTSDQILGEGDKWPEETINIVFTGLALLAMNTNSQEPQKITITIMPACNKQAA